MPRGGTALLAIVALAGTAFAYFTTAGAGEAPAAVTQLAAPTLATPTPGSGQVALSWSAVSAPGSGGVTYYVRRDGGAPAGSCPPPAAPSPVTSCTDTGVAEGTHTYTVTAVWRSWSATSVARSASVMGGAVTHFAISASTSTPAAGTADDLTITAEDEGGATVTTYVGSHELVFSGASASPGGSQPTVVDSAGTAVPFGSPTALTFTNGVTSVSSSRNGALRAYRAGPASVLATEGTVTTAVPLALTVTPLAASKLTLAAASATPAAGAADDLTIAAVDAYGNTATSYAGTKGVTFSGAGSSPGGNAPTVSSSSGTAVAFGTATPIAFLAGVAKAAGGANGTMRLFGSGTAAVRASEGSLTSAAPLALTISPGPASKLVLGAATLAPVAGAADDLTTTAEDEYGNVATAYAGTHQITFAGGEASPSGETPTVADRAGNAVAIGSPTALDFAAGVAAVSAAKNGLMRLTAAGATEISASDEAISTTSPLSLTVAAGSASNFALAEVVLSAGEIGSPCLFSCEVASLGNSGTVTGRVAVTDALGNVVSNLGTGHKAKITAKSGKIAGSPVTISSSGPAVSSAVFVYTAPAKRKFTDTIKIARSAGTVYSEATATVTR